MGPSLVDVFAARTGRAIDMVYAKLVHSLGFTGPFFSRGWGDLGVVDFEQDKRTLACWPPEHFDIQVQWKKLGSGKTGGVQYEKLQGEFRTPCIGRTYDALPPESRMARVQLLLPKLPLHRVSCVVHLAGTGDHGFERRLSLAQPLLKEGVACLALESPYYGKRRPPYQHGSKLRCVSDLLTLGRATIEETLFLLHWAASEGVSKLGTSGFSMGGVHASMAAALYPGPCAVAPLLAPRSAAIAYCRGALRGATAWEPLALLEDERQMRVAEAVHTAVEALAQIQAGALLRAETLVERQLQRSEGLLRELLPQHGADLEAGLAAGHAPGTSAPTFAASSGSAAERHAVGTAAAGAAMAAKATLPPHLHGRAQDDWVAAATGGAVSTAGLDTQLAAVAAGAAAHPRSLQWLNQVLEAYTDVTKYPRPQRPDAAVIVAATDDAYVAPQSVLEHHAYWPGSEVRWVPGGHVSAFLLHRHEFRRAISDALSRL